MLNNAGERQIYVFVKAIVRDQIDVLARAEQSTVKQTTEDLLAEALIARGVLRRTARGVLVVQPKQRSRAQADRV